MLIWNYFYFSVHCKWSSWGKWTSCSKSCGRGVRYRSRRKVQAAKHGGRRCNGSNRTKQSCSIRKKCPGIIKSLLMQVLIENIDLDFNPHLVQLLFKIILTFQFPVSGHLGEDGLLVLRSAGMELDKEPGELADMQKMVAGVVTEVVVKEHHVMCEVEGTRVIDIVVVVPLGEIDGHGLLDTDPYAQAAFQDAENYAREIVIVGGLNIALEAIVEEIVY